MSRGDDWVLGEPVDGAGDLDADARCFALTMYGQLAPKRSAKCFAWAIDAAG